MNEVNQHKASSKLKQVEVRSNQTSAERAIADAQRRLNEKEVKI